MLHRRRVCRRAEFEISSPSYAPTCGQNALPDLFYLLCEIRFEIRDPRADGNLQDEVLPLAAVGARGPARKFDLVESNGTVAAVTRLYDYCYLIYEHSGMLSQLALF